MLFFRLCGNPSATKQKVEFFLVTKDILANTDVNEWGRGKGSSQPLTLSHTY